MSGGPSVIAGGLSDVDELKAAWLAVHHQHQSVAPHAGPYVGDDESWAVRRELYASLLERSSTALVIARDGNRVVGYALGYVMTASDRRWVDDTWSVDGVMGEIESLSVLPEYRGAGVGTTLLEEVARRLAASGATNLVLGVLPDNVGALALYRRLGFEPVWSYFARWDGRATQSSGD